VYDEAWHAGVVGLAAGRLASKHGKPAAVGFVTRDGPIRVSLRGRPGFHIGKLLNACSEHLEGFGGHAGLCNITHYIKNIDRSFISVIIVNK
jgi:single-stranded-DNA-specific exonuclease